MADSVTATDIPPGKYDLVAGYVDGAYTWTDQDWLFHHASKLVRITVLGGDTDADVADVESGDLTPAQGAAWVKGRLAAGKNPALYFSLSRNAEIDAAVAAVGVGPNDGWLKWWASWDGVATLGGFGVAKQYANPTLSGGHFDLSVVADYWPGVDPHPLPAGSRPASLGNLTDAQLVNIFATSTTADVLRQYGQAGYDYMSALYHHWPLPAPGSPTLPPAPPSGPPLDQARASWARLGELLITDFPGTVARIEAAIAKINALP